MGEQNTGKLNWLQQILPEGLLVNAAWLQRHGYSGSLRSKYVAHGWLETVGRGIYRRPRARLSNINQEPVGWDQIVVSLQLLLNYPVAIGGRSALELQGFAHYLSPAGPREIHLYSAKTLPAWLSRIQVDVRLVPHNAQRLFSHKLVLPLPKDLDERWKQDDPPDNGQESLIPLRWGNSQWTMIGSSPERAILELLDMLPVKETFHQVDMLMDGLRTLSPRRMQTLLLDCRSVKVKRLFFWFAERHNHAWLKQIDRHQIDFGKGKRMIVRGGKLDPKFNITVPENIDAGG